MVGGCVFYLELTPNGYGSWYRLKEGQCVLWLALAELPSHIAADAALRQVEVELTVRCDEIAYVDKKTATIAPYTYNASCAGYSFRGQESVALSKFEDLER